MSYLRRVLRDLGHVDRLLLAVLAVLAMTPFGRLFASSEYLVYAAGAVIVALLASVLVAPRRPFVVTLLVAAAGLAVYEVMVVFRITTPVPSDLSGVWSGATGSFQALLGTSLPAVASPQLLTVPVLLAWATTVAAIGLAARTRFVALVLLPGLLAYVGALLFVGQRPVEGPWAPLAILAVSLAIVLIRANARGPEADATSTTDATTGDTGPRLPVWLRVGIPTLAIASVIGVVAGAALPLVRDQERVDLRERYQPPLDLSSDATPLSLIPAAHANDNAESSPPMFKVTLTYPDAPHPPVNLVRIASLEAYDGAVWTTRSPFTQVGDELPPAPAATASTFRVEQDYAIGSAYPSPFLPALERPVEIDRSLLDTEDEAQVLVYDRDAGMLVHTGGRPPAGFRYGVTSAVTAVDEEAVRRAPGGNDPAFAALAAIPDERVAPIPGSVAEYARDQRFLQGSDYDSLKAIEKDMRENFGYTGETGLDGSLAALGEFLARPGTEGAFRARTGDGPQFAAALALIARIKGLPSRVAVGYRVPDPAATTGGEVEVKAKDIHAWAEVHFRGIGWVAFDGANLENPANPKAPPPTTTAPPPPTTRAPQRAEGASGAATARETCDVIATDCGTTRTYLVVWPLLLLAVLLLIPVLIVLAKWIRRRRRRRGSPTQRALGAWRETMDRLRAHGVPTSNAMTAAELAGTSTDTVGDDAARRLAEFTPVLDSVLYQPGEPGEDLADTAWDAEAGVAEAIKHRYGAMARFRARIDPRPLLKRK